MHDQPSSIEGQISLCFVIQGREGMEEESGGMLFAVLAGRSLKSPEEQGRTGPTAALRHSR
jgi:hypothetical protein